MGIRSKNTLCALLALALALAALGCGGGDDEGGGSAAPADEAAARTAADNAAETDDAAGDESPSSRAEFVSKANAICLRQNEGLMGEIENYEVDRSGKKSPAELNADLVRAVRLPAVEASTREIQGLEPPAEDQAQVAAILEARERAARKLARLRQLSSAEQVDAIFAEAGELARAYGLDQCVDTGDASR